MDQYLSTWLVLVFIVAGFVLIISWIVLPFAVFGLKRLMRDVVHQQQRTNELLEQWSRERNGRS